MKPKHLFIILAIILAGGAIYAGLTQLRPQEGPTVQGITSKWANSAHADDTAEAFTHWDEDDPPVIPPSCAKCHSGFGYLDYLGEDGSTPGSVDDAAQTGLVVTCNTCHNETAHQATSVKFPSGVEIAELGSEKVCMDCHQGTQSGDSVNGAVTGMETDTVYEELGFINVHYAIAAATQLGTEAQGGYEYEGKTYAGRFKHTEELQTCTDCHSPHGLGITPQACSPCHLNVVDQDDLIDIRQAATGDYDGDGDTTEGVAGEISTLHEALYKAIQDYAAATTEAPIIYADAYPYFFTDTNGDGEADPDEANFGNRYITWTPRLLKAAYNYQFVGKDHGGYAHNPDYLVQLLYDSIEDLGEKVTTDMSGMARP